VTGWTLGVLPGQTAQGLHDAVVIRLSAGGERTWMRQFGSSNMDDPLGISVDDSGVYVAGLTGGSLPGQKNAGNVDTFVAKLDPSAGRQTAEAASSSRGR
jgi:hypothetical protein